MREFIDVFRKMQGVGKTQRMIEKCKMREMMIARENVNRFFCRERQKIMHSQENTKKKEVSNLIHYSSSSKT